MSVFLKDIINNPTARSLSRLFPPPYHLIAVNILYILLLMLWKIVKHLTCVSVFLLVFVVGEKDWREFENFYQ
ncbi:hypothetical protein DAPPUDRAFT_305510 [Daphnia pulex]|uniref:Uncharacterized protein n=1 Tax=Daphnia pulex TaxID=6669 RepID=E9FXA1_DAPPU|nr:hypothetical protein DAPPUDRAFT_305510 [Daphnia pulex]|eukprot:EFX88042.1 hypothetical protein DAPPUDRAFT_305510 [Daphnia pulex]